jgi:uncharacterized protein
VPRPMKCRQVCCLPGVNYFKPVGIPMKNLEEIRLTVEELEALRLKEIEGLDQQKSAVKMGVSRPTFQRILATARHKTAQALITGKALRIDGGSYSVKE